MSSPLSLTDNFSVLNFQIDLYKSLNESESPTYTNVNFNDIKNDLLFNKLKELDMTKLHLILKDSFSLFDINKTNEIEIDDVRYCIYSLGLAPSETQFLEIFKELRIIENLNSLNKLKRAKFLLRNNNKIPKVKYDAFAQVMIPVIVSGVCLPKSKDVIESAFRKIANISNEDFIDKEYLVSQLSSNGEKFKVKEIESLRDYLSLNESLNGYVQDLTMFKFDLKEIYSKNQSIDVNSILKKHGFEINSFLSD